MKHGQITDLLEQAYVDIYLAYSVVSAYERAQYDGVRLTHEDADKALDSIGDITLEAIKRFQGAGIKLKL